MGWWCCVDFQLEEAAAAIKVTRSSSSPHHPTNPHPQTPNDPKISEQHIDLTHSSRASLDHPGFSRSSSVPCPCTRNRSLSLRYRGSSLNNRATQNRPSQGRVFTVQGPKGNLSGRRHAMRASEASQSTLSSQGKKKPRGPAPPATHPGGQFGV